MLFQSTPSAWRETCRDGGRFGQMGGFQSTPSAWRETLATIERLTPREDFNPLPPHGGRLSGNLCYNNPKAHFNPLPPHGGRLPHNRDLLRPGIHFNPLPPHGGRRTVTETDRPPRTISIHSLRMEGDYRQDGILTVEDVFQSTPSAWRETASVALAEFAQIISIHSLRMEGDYFKAFLDVSMMTFQSTPSAWRETLFQKNTLFLGYYFNPLPPHGGRPSGTHQGGENGIFQSTPSAWRETKKKTWSYTPAFQFQSTPSAWRETNSHYCPGSVRDISIHSLRMEGDA